MLRKGIWCTRCMAFKRPHSSSLGGVDFAGVSRGDSAISLSAHVGCSIHSLKALLKSSGLDFVEFCRIACMYSALVVYWRSGPERQALMVARNGQCGRWPSGFVAYRIDLLPVLWRFLDANAWLAPLKKGQLLKAGGRPRAVACPIELKSDCSSPTQALSRKPQMTARQT